jgi:hypothetical protein
MVLAAPGELGQNAPRDTGGVVHRVEVGLEHSDALVECVLADLDRRIAVEEREASRVGDVVG